MGSDSTASEIPKGLRASKQTFDLTSFSFLLPDRCSTSSIVRIFDCQHPLLSESSIVGIFDCQHLRLSGSGELTWHSGVFKLPTVICPSLYTLKYSRKAANKKIDCHSTRIVSLSLLYVGGC